MRKKKLVCMSENSRINLDARGITLPITNQLVYLLKHIFSPWCVTIHEKCVCPSMIRNTATSVHAGWCCERQGVSLENHNKYSFFFFFFTFFSGSKWKSAISILFIYCLLFFLLHKTADIASSFFVLFLCFLLTVSRPSL